MNWEAELGGAYIAIDWGTTNRRTYLMGADGGIVDSFRDDRGILAMTAGDYPRELAAIRSRLGDLPVIAAGMVGSNRGWLEVPYVRAPADMDALAAGRVAIDDLDCAIVPGIALDSGRRTDVMRGEEVQVFGAIADGLAPESALFCQPGTHNKWIETDGGRVVDIVTAMTGELFALMREHGILAGILNADISDGTAFRKGVERGAGATDLAVALFEIRSGILLGALKAEDAASTASGILIGADVGARAYVAGRDVHLLASGGLADLYAAAIGIVGGSVRTINSHRAFAAGIHRIWEIAR